MFIAVVINADGQERKKWWPSPVSYTYACEMNTWMINILHGYMYISYGINITHIRYVGPSLA